ncbi:Oil body-associated protein 1a [Rhynchospora pubera]|uniref:Oil body-associated protein 1a n=1 Tax=Rhynchospora pubera TaxID=906938 RepID=A0AAV8DHW7_9POAL|nr:Oil body-associated protein 1a [Rhynchospora pubera]
MKLAQSHSYYIKSVIEIESERERESNLMATSHVDVPGEPTETGTALLETATGTIQGFQPINNIHQHLCAFHFYAHDMTRQVEAHHFCGHLNEDVRQCLIYDSPNKDARLIGIEYIVVESLFLTLPDDEKPLWHSHEFEVKGGYLFMPGVPGMVERQDLKQVCKTYGKVIHFWQVDRGDPLPLGIPQIMMALTRPGQLDENIAKDVEKRFGVSFEEQREQRKDLTGPDHGIHPLANAAGRGLKTELREVDIPPATSMPRVFV